MTELACNSRETHRLMVFRKKNWVHSSPKFGLRFDAGKHPYFGYNGTLKANVIWKCGGIMVKGEFHTVVNNLAFGKRNDYSGDKTIDGCTLCVLKVSW